MNHYKVLGLSRDCSDDDVKKAWRKVARTTHPDTASSDGAEHLYLAAQEAFETLSDPSKRAAYDRSLKGASSSYASSSSTPPSSDSSWGAGEPYDVPSSFGRGEQGHGNGAPGEGKGYDYGNFYGYSSPDGQYGPRGNGYHPYEHPPYEHPSEGVSYSSERSSSYSGSSRGLVHRASWTTWVGVLAILVPMFVLFEPVAGGMNAWGVTFLVTGALMLGLVVQSGTGYRDWKWWVWVLMGFWFVSTQDSGWLGVAYFAVPATGAVLSMWRDGAAPVGSSSRGKKKAAAGVA